MYRVSNAMAVDVGYKFFGTAAQKYVNHTTVTDVYAHYIGLSFTRKF